MKKQVKKSKIPLVASALLGLFAYSITRRKLDEIDSKRHTLKFFKTEVTQSFWGKKVKYIQRDKPLTDLEVDEILKRKKWKI